MADKVKLVIEIPKYDLSKVQNGSIASKMILNAVQNGKPLSDVLNEIKGEITKGQAYSSITYISNVIEIIDNHIGDKG